MSITDKISTLVKNQFPDFYKEEGANFLAFIQAYYEWMEETGQMTDAVRSLQSYRDISTTTEDFIEYFRNDFLPSVPTDMVADKSIAIKYVKYFNQSRGTFAAYKLLFRALYGEDIDLNLPSTQILKVSDGDWRIDRYLVVPYDISTYDLIGNTIVGVESGATALVEDVIRRVIRNEDIQQILLSDIVGTFIDQEPIRLETDVFSTGFIPFIEAGINRITITSGGARYEPGDVVDIISDNNGLFGKVIVTETIDLGGALTFSITNGGSGYRASTVDPGSTINIVGGDGSGASFVVEPSDIDTTYPLTLTLNGNRIGDRTSFATLAPSIVNTDGIARQMETYANTIIGAPRYGFFETVVGSTFENYHEYGNALLRIANTNQGLVVGDSIYGDTSGANGQVTQVVTTTNGDAIFKINGYKKWTPGETIRVSVASGSVVGTATSFTANTYGNHHLNIANTVDIALGDELYGQTSQAYAVVTKIVDATAGDAVLSLSANATSNVSNQFDSGPIKAFANNESISFVTAPSVTIGTAKNRTSNVITEDVHTALIDALSFETYNIGTIRSLSLQDGGTGYTTTPNIRVFDQDINSLRIRDYYLKLQSDDLNWGTGNSFFTTLSSSDRLEQTSTGASGYIVSAGTAGQPISVSQYANGTYETYLHVWQDINQSSITSFANNATITLKTYLGAYTQGSPQPDVRTLTNTGTAKVVEVVNGGILGNNAIIDSAVGANGAITKLKVIDSGFSYYDGERVRLGSSGRSGAVRAQGTVHLQGDANSEGYYATTRSQISTIRGFIQDGYYYQEYSYEILSPISLARYRDVALKLVHPAGQALFGKYRLQANADVTMGYVSESKKRYKANGSISMTQGSFDITGTGTSLTANYANGDDIIVEYSPRSFYTIRINKVSNTTFANTTIAWSNSSISTANIYYTSTASSANIYYSVG